MADITTEKESFVKRLRKSPVLPFLIYGAILLLFHFFMQENNLQDVPRYFSKVLDTQSFFDFLSERYFGYSSRLLIEGTLVLVSRSMFLWKLLDILVWLLLAWSLSKFLGTTNDAKMNWIVIGFVLLYPVGEMSSAGWSATMTVYIWPLAFGLYALTILARIHREECIRPHTWILTILAACFAANNEQMCMILFPAFLIGLLYEWKQKKHGAPALLILLFVTTAALLFALTCPGNKARAAEEIEKGIHEFSMLTVSEKLYLSFTDTMEHFQNFNLLFFVFTALLMILVILRYRKPAAIILSAFPAVFALQESDLGHFFPWYLFLTNENGLTMESYMNAAPYFRLTVWIVVWLVIILELILLTDGYFACGCLCLLLLDGLATRLIMGFSPTLYISGERTFLYLYFTMIVISLCLIQKHRPMLAEKPKLSLVLRCAFGILVTWSVINSASFITRWDVFDRL